MKKYCTLKSINKEFKTIISNVITKTKLHLIINKNIK